MSARLPPFGLTVFLTLASDLTSLKKKVILIPLVVVNYSLALKPSQFQRFSQLGSVLWTFGLTHGLTVLFSFANTSHAQAASNVECL